MEARHSRASSRRRTSTTPALPSHRPPKATCGSPPTTASATPQTGAPPFTTLRSYGNAAYALGFGAPAPGYTYPALYLIGQLAGDSLCEPPGTYTGAFTLSTECIYRSVDAGATFVHVNDFQHQFSSPGIITGDPRVFGRYYLGTPGRGILQADSPD